MNGQVLLMTDKISTADTDHTVNHAQ